MVALSPWHNVAVPREDLRKGIPLDAAEFAIHLDQVIDGRAPQDYRDPERFFARTFLTAAMREIAAEVLRRLAGHIIGTSPGLNLTTQFGGGKTHFLTLLYHLVTTGSQATTWAGVDELLKQAGLSFVPRARVAVFIGNRFDFVVGTGASDEPKRKTPWGDIAWQLGGPGLFELVREHDASGVVPGGEIVQRWFEPGPALILMDEVLSFTRRAREAGGPYARLGSQFYSFLDVLTREVAGTSNAVLVVSLPLSEYEMTAEDETEFQRLDKLLDRLSKATLLSEHTEVAEIVRRRLFESFGRPEEVNSVAKAYAAWVQQHRQQLPEWFPVDVAEALFSSTYPFHPTVLSVFERKWQSLPRFQRTRGVLRLLALWVSHAYRQAYVEGSHEPLITLGSAPLVDSDFRAAVFEQLGEQDLEAAVLSDIAGEEAHAIRLDAEMPDSLKRYRLHQKVATTVFFESSGGQVRAEATVPEIRLAVGSPDLEIGHVETALENLVRRCYYLDSKGTAYWLSHRPTVNKLIADRRASLAGPAADEEIRDRVRRAIRDVFRADAGLERRFFPERSQDIPDAPSLTLVILAPDYEWRNDRREHARAFLASVLHHYGERPRTFKSGLIFIVAEDGAALADEARTLVALESLQDPSEQTRYRLEPAQVEELRVKKQRSERTLRERVWSSYRHVVLLGESGDLQTIDLGITHPSMASSLIEVIVRRLKQEGLLEERVSPHFLARNWPPALTEWSTKAVRDVFFQSPRFPRLIQPETLRETIAEGVQEGLFGYAVRAGAEYSLRFEDLSFTAYDVEFSDDAVLLTPETARALAVRTAEGPRPVEEAEVQVGAGELTIAEPTVDEAVAETGQATVTLAWEGNLPSQKWSQFYMRVLTRFATDPTLRLYVHFAVTVDAELARPQVEEIRMALRELGLDETSLRFHIPSE